MNDNAIPRSSRGSHPSTHPRLPAALLAFCAATAAASLTRAATYTWDGGLSHGNLTANDAWSTPNNWVDGTPPSSNINNDFIFTLSGLRTTSTEDISTIFLLHSITFDSTSNVTALTGNTLDFFTNSASAAPFITQNSATAVSLSSALTLTNTVTLNGTGNLTLSGAISGSGGLTKSGTGSVTLTGAGTFVGNVTVNAGAFTVTTGGSLTNSLVSAGPGGTINVTGGNINAGTAAFFQLGTTSSATAANVILTSGSTISTETDVANAFGSKATFSQSGGTHTTAGNLYLGIGSSSNGTYNLSGTGQLSTTDTYVAGFGNATFNQTGGTHTNSGTLHLGQSTGLAAGVGAYNLIGGTLSTNDIIQGPGTGTFNFGGGTLQARSSNATFMQGLTTAIIQAGGAIIDTQAFNITIAQPLLHDATLGATGDGGLTKNGAGNLTLSATETYTGNTTLNAGTLTLPAGSSLSNTLVAINAGATLTISGGSVTSGAATFFGVGDSAASSLATANLASGTLTTGETDVGNAVVSTALFNQTGGTHSISGTLFVAVALASTGTYNLSGTSQLTDTGAIVGRAGAGTFNQSGGTHTVAGSLQIGFNGSSSGVYSLSGAGQLSTIDTYLGDLGPGTFNQTGGTHAITNLLHFGDSGGGSGGTGTYILSGGTLITARLFRGAGTGIFDFNGGTLEPNAATTTFLQSLNSAIVQAGGALINTNSFDITIAQPLLHDATLGVTLDGGLTKSGVGTLTLTASETYTGATTVNAGAITLSGTGALTASTVRVAPGATFNLNGGTVSFASGTAVQVGTTSSATPAIFNFTSGVITSIETDVADASTSTATFNQTGGSQSVTSLFIGLNSLSGTGSYLLSAPGQLIAGDVYVGSSGIGSFVQSSGTVSLINALHLSLNATGNGTYQLSSGTLTTPQIVGGSGTGVFDFNGGTLIPSASTTSFMQGFTAARIQSGAAIINTGGFNITIAQALLHDSALLGGVNDGGLTKNGTGNLTLSATNTYTGGTTVNAGLLVFSTTAARPTNDKLTLNLTSNLGPKVVVKGDSANLANYRTALLASFGTAEQWQGTTGSITTTSAKVTSGTATQGIGYATGAEYLLLHSATAFAPNYTVLTTDVLLRYTYMGDATLDGKITIADYAQIDSTFLLNTATKDWLHGDFNYDGVVNYQDYALIDAAFHIQSGALADTEISDHSAEFGAPYLAALNAALAGTPVPEPASLLFTLAALPLILRRRKHHPI